MSRLSRHSGAIRLTALLTHPVQYYSPWFRHISGHAPEIDLTVLYATAPHPEQQGVGFDTAFSWDVPLLGGYEARFARDATTSDCFDAQSFRGVDVPDIARHIADTRPDVLLVPGWNSIVYVRALAAARRRGIPAIYRGDTHLGGAPVGWRYMPWRLKTSVLLRMFSGYLAVGTRARDYLMDFGLDHRRVFVSPHVVDNDRFAAAASALQDGRARCDARSRLGIEAQAFVVIFVGKFEGKKRPLDLIHAAARLSTPVVLLFVGAGPLERTLRDEVAAAGVDARFAGFVNQSELGRMYGAADCLALPSDWGETWGLVVNEALACGLPVVVSDRVGCAPDLVDDSTGHVFPCGDVDALARALDSVRTRGRSVPYATACRDRVSRFGFAAATRGLADACRVVIDGVPAAAADVRVVACCGHMVTVTGLERHTFATLSALRDRGAAVHCIVNSWEHHRITPLADEIGATWSIGSYHYPLRRRHVTPARLAGMTWEILKTSAGLLRDVRRTRATVVLVPDHVVVVRNAPALAWLRLRGRVRVIAQLGSPPDEGAWYRRYWRYLQNTLVDHFVGNSNYTAAELSACGIPAAKISMVYNVLPQARRIAAPSSWTGRTPGRAVFVGQVIPQKGVDLLIEAVALLRERGVPVTLDVVGDIDGWTTPEFRTYREALRTRAAAIGDAVRFLGWREDVSALLANAVVHCAPSRREQREGFGYVVLEAKEAGLPSVVCPSGALPELVRHRVDGWVCPACTPAALAEGLEYFVVDPERARQAGIAARTSSESFVPARYADFWWALARGAAVTPPRSVPPVMST